MDKKLQDLVWSILPKEFKEEVTKLYTEFYNEKPHSDCSYGYLGLLIKIFGIHNLTSDAEGEELLMVGRKVIQEAYAANERIKKEYPRSIMYKQSDAVNGFLWGLFGSKCLPSSVPSTKSDVPSLNADEDNFASKEPKPAEPKFNVDDYVWYRGEVRKVAATKENNRYYLTGITESVSASDLEHYQQPFSKVKEYAAYDSNGIDRFGQQFDGTSIAAHGKTDDHIADTGKMMRLNIAAVMAQGLLSNGNGFYIDDKSVDKTPENIAEAALLFADALINEAEKGGNNE